MARREVPKVAEELANVTFDEVNGTFEFQTEELGYVSLDIKDVFSISTDYDTMLLKTPAMYAYLDSLNTLISQEIDLAKVSVSSLESKIRTEYIESVVNAGGKKPTEKAITLHMATDPSMLSVNEALVEKRYVQKRLSGLLHAYSYLIGNVLELSKRERSRLDK